LILETGSGESQPNGETQGDYPNGETQGDYPNGGDYPCCPMRGLILLL
jgi:hypothetical protein